MMKDYMYVLSSRICVYLHLIAELTSCVLVLALLECLMC